MLIKFQKLLFEMRSGERGGNKWEPGATHSPLGSSPLLAEPSCWQFPWLHPLQFLPGIQLSFPPQASNQDLRRANKNSYLFPVLPKGKKTAEIYQETGMAFFCSTYLEGLQAGAPAPSSWLCRVWFSFLSASCRMHQEVPPPCTHKNALRTQAHDPQISPEWYTSV